MPFSLLVLALQVTSPPAGVVPHVEPAPRWAFVSAYVTLPTERSRRRIKVVTPVFAFCDADELPSTVFAAADPALRAAVRRLTRASFTITHRALEVRTTRDSAEAARARGLRDGRFTVTLEAGALRAPCAGPGPAAPR